MNKMNENLLFLSVKIKGSFVVNFGQNVSLCTRIILSVKFHDLILKKKEIGQVFLVVPLNFTSNRTYTMKILIFFIKKK